MRYSVRTITAITAIATAIDLTAAKAHMRVNFDDDDLDITAKIKAAQGRIEKHMARPITPRDLELTLDRFPCFSSPIDLRRAGVTEILSVKYTNSIGDEATVASTDYRWSATDPEILLPAFDAAWPALAACEPGAVRIQFTAGYAAGECPDELLEALKRMTAYLYENREAAGEIPPGVVALCAGFRRHPNGSSL